MVAQNFGSVTGELILAFILRKRTVTLIRAQRIAECGSVAAAGASEVEIRQARGERLVQIETGDAGIRGGLESKAVGRSLHVVFHVAKAEICNQRRRKRVRDAE